MAGQDTKQSLVSVNGRYIVLPPWNALNDPVQANTTIPDPMAQGTSKVYPISTKFVEFDRVWRYIYNGGSVQLDEGWGGQCYMLQEEQGAPAADVALGGTTITMADVTSVGLNMYAGGWLVLKETDGYMYRILSNEVGAGSDSPEYTIERAAGFHQAFTTSAKMMVLINEYADVRKASDATGGATGYSSFVGIAQIPILTVNYSWIQTWGPCYAFAAGTYGNTAHQRGFFFWTDGTLAIDSSGDSGQYAGFGIPFTNPGGSSEYYYQYNIHLMLQIAP